MISRNGSPIAIPLAPRTILEEVGEPPTAVALGEWHMCVVTQSARVWCWGADEVEQLGPFDPLPGERAVELNLLCEDD